MTIGKANHQRDAIIAILTAQGLPAADLPQNLGNFVMATKNGEITGIGGLEIYGDYGLLRSLAVLPQYRDKGIAAQIINWLEQEAAALGLKEIYLLTETAATYFEKKSFRAITRAEVPDAVKLSTEFSHVCPVSAIVMKKTIS